MARKNATGTPYVFLPKIKPGHMYVIQFKHPGRNWKVVRATAGTYDGQEALRLARLLSARILDRSTWNQVPTDPAIARIWGQPEPTGTWRGPAPRIRSWAGPQGDPEVLELKQRLDDALADNMRLRAALADKQGLLDKLGHDQSKNATLPLQDAIADFLKNGHKGKARYVRTVRRDLIRLGEDVGMDTPAGAVTPEQIVNHLQKKKDSGKASKDWLRKLGRRLGQFLAWATGGAFRFQPVQAWINRNASETSRPKPYWLEEDQAAAIIAKMPEPWQGLAWLQWAGGFRPEELIHIQPSKILVNGETVSVWVGPVDSWSPKNRRGTGTVNLPPWLSSYIVALKESRKDCQYLMDVNRQERFYKETFCRKYLEQFKAAAAKVKGIETDRLDGRTLRRSCGKRVLMRELFPELYGREKSDRRNVGNAIEIAAAILRDHPKTVREHYADILPSDVEQI
jgi:hypothetical protein